MGDHLGYDKGEEPPNEQGNRRNGNGSKRVRTGQGELQIEVPRDREGGFEPMKPCAANKPLRIVLR